MILLSLLPCGGCALPQRESRWEGCAVGCWGAGGDVAHPSFCGAGTWVQAQQSFLFFGMAFAVPASCGHPPSHSICHAENRDRSFHRAVHQAEFGLQMPCNGSKTFPPFTGYELTCLADLALIHTQQIQNLWISIMSTWNCILLPMP